jgi:hypothetical protein
VSINNPELTGQIRTHLNELDQFLAHLVEAMNDNTTSLITFDDLQTNVAVALAGVLLEYPLSYVPPNDGSRPLDGIPLRVFDCSLVTSQSKDGVSRQ